MTTRAEPSLDASAQLLDVFKALANPVRLQVLQWLRDPEHHFPVDEAIADPDEVGRIRRNRDGPKRRALPAICGRFRRPAAHTGRRPTVGRTRRHQRPSTPCM